VAEPSLVELLREALNDAIRLSESDKTGRAEFIGRVLERTLAERAEAAGRWIPCSERMPEPSDDRELEVWTGRHRFLAVFYDGVWRSTETNQRIGVLFWRVPTPPPEEP